MKWYLVVFVFFVACASGAETPARWTVDHPLTDSGADAGDQPAPTSMAQTTIEEPQRDGGIDAGDQPAPTPTAQVTIEQPQKDHVVKPIDTVGGTTSHPDADIWVVIQPLSTPGDCWVQSKILPQSDGHWTGSVHFGRPPPRDHGERYEVRAFVNPNQQLTPGKKMSCWPAGPHSDSVIVVRQ
jgi:hypothetical protein